MAKKAGKTAKRVVEKKGLKIRTIQKAEKTPAKGLDKTIFLKIDAIIFYVLSALFLAFAVTTITMIAQFEKYIAPSFMQVTMPRGSIISMFIAMGIIYLVLAVMSFFAALNLWKYKKTGGILAVIVIALGLLFSLMMLFWGFIGLVSLLINIAMLVLLILGWKELS